MPSEKLIWKKLVADKKYPITANFHLRPISHWTASVGSPILFTAWVMGDRSCCSCQHLLTHLFLTFRAAKKGKEIRQKWSGAHPLPPFPSLNSSATSFLIILCAPLIPFISNWRQHGQNSRSGSMAFLTSPCRPWHLTAHGGGQRDCGVALVLMQKALIKKSLAAMANKPKHFLLQH